MYERMRRLARLAASLLPAGLAASVIVIEGAKRW